MTRFRAAVLAVLGVLALLALMAADTNWARPAVVRYLERKSGRAIQLDDLQVRLDAQWQPVVRLRGLRVENAPWASGSKPFIAAREVRFTFDWATLWADVRVVRELRLVEADVDLQRQANGLRNWRLTRPHDRGPGRMRIQRLQAERSELTFAHRGLGLTLAVRSTPLPKPRDGFTQQLSFNGRYREASWAGRADTGPRLSMLDTAEPFAVRGEARSDGTVLVAHGRIADLLQLSALDANLQLKGENLAQLQPFLARAQWPDTRPYRFEGHVVREGTSWAVHDAVLRLGSSDLTGDARYTPARQADERVALQATLRSERLRLADLPGQVVASAATAKATSPSRVLPQHELALGPLRSLDGRLAWQIETLELPQGPAARRLQATATLEQGDVQVRLQHGLLAGGRWQGRLTLDTRRAATAVALQLQAQGVNLPQLWPALARQPGVQWPAVDGDLKLSTAGPTLASWWRALDGQVSVSFTGGSLPKKLDARLGLHTGRMLGALVSGDEPVPIRCGAVSLAFSDGVGRTRALMLATERTQVQGLGSVHLADESWAFVLTPQRQGGTLPASIVAQGTFRDAKFRLAQREPVASSNAKTTCS